MDWSVLTMWEWQAVTGLTVLSAGLAWWTKRRMFRAVAWGSIAVLVLSASFLESSGPGITFGGGMIGAVFLLLMAKQILEPSED
ncbi:hypothetical protein [Melghirimyces algeriensis]|uniref:YesK-like protein n=1 Tax=Melghirimyces algeriensis TaxID=910412 RepID=A0A521DPJ2_9BACL|nr:hypothetical protein [Melghirimyces algeriensis]SMO73613.1 hypothetical protein SAMN06264849_106179 [Melghirimyces algeriensis]